MRTFLFLAAMLPCLSAYAQTINIEPIFPLKVEWKVGDKSGVLTEDAGEVPSGELELTVLPRSTGGWYQIIRLYKGEKELGVALQRAKFPVAEADEIRIVAQQPVPPWNAVIVPVQDEWVMVTLARPWAAYDLALFEKGEWKRDEEFPNTALCWAKHGDEGMAEELANHFCAAREKEPKLWDFRGLRHASIVVPLKDGTITPALRKIPPADLRRQLTQAFRLLRKQKPPVGPSVQEEVDAAKLWLQQHGR